jgi:DNA-directed RNA polymerase specialized sigma24 family protein
MRAWLFTILRSTFHPERRRATREVPDPDGTMSERMAVKPDHDGRPPLADVRLRSHRCRMWSAKRRCSSGVKASPTGRRPL